MKTFALALLLVLFVVAPQARAQTPFEGTATWSMTIPQMDDEKHEMLINMKSDKVETEIDLGAQGGVKTYIDREKKKIYVAMSAMKSGWVLDFPNDSLVKAKTGDIDLKPTGQKVTIAGHPAEEYLLHTNKTDVSMWMSGDFPKEIRDAFHRSMSSQPGQDPGAARAMQQFADKGLVPVKIVVKNGEAIATTIELVKVEPKKLDDSIFVRPKDISFSPMPAGMGGMN